MECGADLPTRCDHRGFSLGDPCLDDAPPLQDARRIAIDEEHKTGKSKPVWSISLLAVRELYKIYASALIARHGDERMGAVSEVGLTPTVLTKAEDIELNSPIPGSLADRGGLELVVLETRDDQLLPQLGQALSISISSSAVRSSPFSMHTIPSWASLQNAS